MSRHVTSSSFLSLFPGHPHFAGVVLTRFSATFLTPCYQSIVGKLPPMGILHPSPVQALAIPALLSSGPSPVEDIALQAVTGSGKTLAYLLPLMANIDPSDDRSS